MNFVSVLDQRRMNNSNAKTLMQNWVEERSVEKYDKIPEDFLSSNQPAIKHFKNGHQGLITLDSAVTKHTTYKGDFIPADRYDKAESKGIRDKLTEKSIRQHLIEEMEKAENLDNDYIDEPTNYVTEAHEKFNVPGFVHKPPEPTARHDIYSEMPISYWTEKRTKVHGVSNCKALDSPFRRNAAFTTPVGETLENAKPGELDKYPYMGQSINNNAYIH